MRDRIAFHAFWVSAALLVFGGGMVVGRYQMLPFRVLSIAKKGFEQLWEPDQVKVNNGFLRKARDSHRAALYCTSQACEGLNFTTRASADGTLSADITDVDGKSLHRWNINWFEIWPDAKHVPAHLIPQASPGTMVDGAVLLENGNLVFNFEYIGLVCLDLQGGVVWRLPYLTHHSITKADDGNLWVCGQLYHTEPTKRIPGAKLPLMEDTLLEVTPEGKIKRELPVIDLLRKNGREDLLTMRAESCGFPSIRGGAFHLNNIEPFPARLKEGFFKKGDVLISLRNINTVLVFNRGDEKIKFVRTGPFVWQHDPDYVDGDTISVFDNHTVGPGDSTGQSRILLISAKDATVKTLYEGTPEHPFYTHVMGKHQWLPNGNLLITESCNGRAFEIDRAGKIVWEYNNYVKEGYVGLVSEVTRLPASYALLFSDSRLYAQALRASKAQEKASIAEKSDGGLQR